jgi:hypothetical protein
MKANAFWWMLARISGWTGPDETIAHKINSDFSLIIYPNPSQDIISININLSNSEYVNCDLIDSKGVKVLEILNNCYFQSGDTKFTQNFEMLSPGIYFIRLRYGKDLPYKYIYLFFTIFVMFKKRTRRNSFIYKRF